LGKVLSLFTSVLIESIFGASGVEGTTAFKVSFLGSGTTTRVAKKMNRNSIGIEVLEEYYNLALKDVTNEAETTGDNVLFIERLQQTQLL